MSVMLAVIVTFAWLPLVGSVSPGTTVIWAELWEVAPTTASTEPGLAGLQEFVASGTITRLANSLRTAMSNLGLDAPRRFGAETRQGETSPGTSRSHGQPRKRRSQRGTLRPPPSG